MEEEETEARAKLKKKLSKEEFVIKEIDNLMVLVTDSTNLEDWGDSKIVYLPKDIPIKVRPPNEGDMVSCVVSVTDFADTLIKLRHAIEQKDEEQIKALQNKLAVISQEVEMFCKSPTLAALARKASEADSEEKLEEVVDEVVREEG